MANPIEEISELEAMVEDQKIETPPDNSALNWSKYAYNVAVFVLDLVTGWTIWQLTFWYYGVLWFMAGAVVFYLHQKNWERAGNNDEQVKISQAGLIVSVVSMVLMAVAAGGLWIAKTSGTIVSPMWSEIGVVGSAIALYAWHSVQLALYYFKDDNFVIERATARAKAQAEKKIKIIQAAGAVVDAGKKAVDERNNQYKRHGDSGAVDRAIAKVEKREFQPGPKQQKPALQPANADVKQEQIRDNGTQKHADPTNPPR